MSILARCSMNLQFVCKQSGQQLTSMTRRFFCWHYTREDKTIESAVPFPAPEKGDNRGLSPFHPRIIIVIGERHNENIEKPLIHFASPRPHWTVWKSSPPSPSPVTGAGTGKGTPSFNVPFRPLYIIPFTFSSKNTLIHMIQVFRCLSSYG